MPVISRQQLQYVYQWSAIPPDDPRVTGIADSTFLSRHEGYEVLPFLNRICKSLAQAVQAERMIRNGLPSNIHSRKNVLDWLNTNWAAYS